MVIDITPILEAVIALVAAIVGVLATFVIRWLRQRLSNNQMNTLKTIVETAVRAVEQLKNAGIIKPQDRKREALEQIQRALLEKKLVIDIDIIDNAIEAAVLELNISQAGAGYKREGLEESN